METAKSAVIQTNGLSKNYDGVSVLSNLNLNVPTHSIFGFLGPNAFHIILFYVGVLYWLAAPLVYRHVVQLVKPEVRTAIWRQQFA